MISFKPLNDENIESVLGKLADGLSEDAFEYLCEIANGLDTSGGDVECAITVESGCALVRIFDMGRYYFVFPCELDEKADVYAALRAVGEYAMREELPLVFVDVPAEALSCFAGYRHMDIDASDELGETYRVRIKTECELIDEIPSVVWGRVELTSLSEEDIQLHDELSRDRELNKFWGYDYSEDVKSPDIGYFYRKAEEEFLRGTAVTMAVRVLGEFCGEATLYAFDGRGGAEFSVRILREKQRCGIGAEATLAVAEAARSIGLVRLRASVMNENEPSLKMMKKVCSEFRVDGGLHFFEIIL